MDKKNWLYTVLVAFLVILAICFFIVGFFVQNMENVAFLGMNKKEAMQFIAYGMGGVLTAIGLVAIGRRADAQVRNNELIEIGHIEDRFKSATESLGSKSSGSRIAAFYQFYYLAKDNKPGGDFRKNIFEILCAHLREMTSQESYRVVNDQPCTASTDLGVMSWTNGRVAVNDQPRTAPTIECQTLLDILFKPEGENMFAGFRANLQYAYLTGVNLQNAQMEGADFSGANLRGADFLGAKLIGARLCHVGNLTDAMLVGVSIDLTHAASRPPWKKWGFYADPDSELWKISKYSDSPRTIPDNMAGWGDPPGFGGDS